MLSTSSSGPHFLPGLQPWATYWKNQRALQSLPGKSLGLEAQILALKTLSPKPKQATPPSTCCPTCDDGF